MGLTKLDNFDRVSYTSGFFDHVGPCMARDEEHIPAADKSIFDHAHSPDLVSQANDFIDSEEWIHGPLPPTADTVGEVQFAPSIFDDEFDDDDAIRIPSMDANMRWSPHNPVIKVPNIDRVTLARAVSDGERSIQDTQLNILEQLKRMTQEQSLKQNKPKDWISEQEITDMDVICERGGKSNRHHGTKRYRGMIEKFKSEYQNMSAKTDKTNLSRKIIAQIQNNHGRFLKKDEPSGHYFVLSPVETTKKVSQALREKKILKWTENA